MSNADGLPKGWAPVTLDTIGVLHCGQSPTTATVNRNQEGVPYATGPEQWDGNTLTVDKWTTAPRRVVPDGCIFITVKGAGVGTIFPGTACAIGRDIYAYQPCPYVSPKFIEHSLRFNISQVLRNARGDIPGLSKRHILDHVAALPPLNEQRRIVAKIEELFSYLDAGVAALERARANLKRYRAAVLKAAVEGKLTAQWRADHPPRPAGEGRGEGIEPAPKLLQRILTQHRKKWEQQQLAAYKAKGKKPPKNWRDQYKEPTAPDPTNHPELPQGWCWADLEQIKEWAMYGPRFSSSLYSDDGSLVLRTTDFSDAGKVNVDTPPRIPLADEVFAKYKVNIGDLLVTRTGSLGTLAVYMDTADAIAGAFLIHYRLAAPLLTTWYVFYFLKSPAGQRHLLTGGAGVGRPNLNMPKIDSIPIPFPPLGEQEEIVAGIESRLSVIDRTDSQCEADLKRAARLRQSILKRAFEGKLVPQGPTDEPAAAFLERIERQRRVSTLARKDKRTNNVRSGRSWESKTAGSVSAISRVGKRGEQ